MILAVVWHFILLSFQCDQAAAQAGVLACGNPDFVTNLFTNVINVNRDRLRRNDPMYLGYIDNLGIMTLDRAKLYSAHTAFLRDKITVYCNDTVMYLIVPIGVKNTTLEIDYIAPLRIIEGRVNVTMSVFGGDLHITTAVSRLKTPEIKAKILRISLWATDDLTFRFGDPIYRTLGFAFNLLHRTLQRSIDIILERTLQRAFQHYVDENPLPL